jgi:hypothetical protein
MFQLIKLTNAQSHPMVIERERERERERGGGLHSNVV